VRLDERKEKGEKKITHFKLKCVIDSSIEIRNFISPLFFSSQSNEAKYVELVIQPSIKFFIRSPKFDRIVKQTINIKGGIKKI
jgi:hypothetical protein